MSGVPVPQGLQPRNEPSETAVPRAWTALKDDAKGFAESILNAITAGGLPGHEGEETKGMEHLLQTPPQQRGPALASMLTNIPLEKVKTKLQSGDYAGALTHVLAGLATAAAAHEAGGGELPESGQDWAMTSDLRPTSARKWANFLNEKNVTFKQYRNVVPEMKPAGYVPSAVDELTAERDPAVIEQVKDLHQNYKKNRDLQALAHSARYYVHNNDPITNASRLLLGMDPLVPPYQDVNSLVMKLGKDPVTGTIHSIPGLTEMKDEQFPAWYVKQAPGDPGVQLPNGTYDKRAVMPLPEAKRHAANLMQAVREAPVLDRWRERGLGLAPEHYQTYLNLKPGDTINLPLSSFTTDPIVSDNFAGGLGKEPVKLVLRGPHKAVNVQPLNHFSESEWLTHGKFEVERVDKPGTVKNAGPLKVYIKQVGTF